MKLKNKREYKVEEVKKVFRYLYAFAWGCAIILEFMGERNVAIMALIYYIFLKAFCHVTVLKMENKK